MIKSSISFEHFPAADRTVGADWAPVILEPIEGSYERLVVGIAAVAGNEVLVMPANDLGRLRCLYGPRAAGVLDIVSMSLAHLQELLFENGSSALRKDLLFSGLSLGKVRKGEGNNLEELAEAWLASLSSLHNSGRDTVSLTLQGEKDLMQQRATEPLGTEVLQIVARTKPALGTFFNRDIVEGRVRRRSVRVQEPIIDFVGERLVANFDVIRSDRLTPSIDAIKRRMWDLKVDRDNRHSKRFTHEMLVRTLVFDENKEHLVTEALGELEKQADQQSLRLESFDSPKEIANRVLEIEQV
jgi:hypothetical protein